MSVMPIPTSSERDTLFTKDPLNMSAYIIKIFLKNSKLIESAQNICALKEKTPELESWVLGAPGGFSQWNK